MTGAAQAMQARFRKFGDDGATFGSDNDLGIDFRYISRLIMLVLDNIPCTFSSSLWVHIS